MFNSSAPQLLLMQIYPKISSHTQVEANGAMLTGKILFFLTQTLLVADRWACSGFAHGLRMEWFCSVLSRVFSFKKINKYT